MILKAIKIQKLIDITKEIWKSKINQQIKADLKSNCRGMRISVSLILKVENKSF